MRLCACVARRTLGTVLLTSSTAHFRRHCAGLRRGRRPLAGEDLLHAGVLREGDGASGAEGAAEAPMSEGPTLPNAARLLSICEGVRYRWGRGPLHRLWPLRIQVPRRGPSRHLGRGALCRVRIDLKSTTTDWPASSRVNARFRGTCTVDGEGLHTFRVLANDGSESGTGRTHPALGFGMHRHRGSPYSQGRECVE